MNLNKKYFLLLSICAAACIGCGSDDDDEFDGGSSATSVSVDPAIAPLGTGVIASVEFTFSADDIFDDDRDVVVAVSLPANTQYRPGTAEIDRPIDDRDVEPEIITCADGTSFLRFNLDEEELTDAENPGGNADARVKFTLDAVQLGNGAIGAAANNDSFAVVCGSPLPAQASALVDVV